MEGTGEIGPVPTASLWPWWAKMARNGAAEGGRCSSGQRGAAEGGIGRAPAVSLRMGSVCWATSQGDAHRRSQEQEQEDAWAAAGKKRPKVANLGWARSVQRLETSFPLFTARERKFSDRSTLRESQG